MDPFTVSRSMFLGGIRKASQIQHALTLVLVGINTRINYRMLYYRWIIIVATVRVDIDMGAVQ